MSYPLPKIERFPTGTICAYCGVRVLTGSERAEHPLPASLGGARPVYTVCDPCNDWVSVYVDQPFLADDWLRIIWAKHDLKIQRRRGRGRVASPLKHGVTSDGIEVRVDDDWRPHLASGITHNEETGEINIRAGSEEEAERLLGRVRKQARERGEEAVIRSWSTTPDRPLVNIPVSTNLVVWRRMAAKIALGFGSVAYPEDWRTSEAADRLRRDLREEVVDDDGNHMGVYADRIDETHILRRLVEPPEHLVCWLPGSGQNMAVILFGELLFGADTEADGFERPAHAWRHDPRSGAQSVETTFDGLMFRLFEAAS